ncbi:MAG: phosphoribosyltransferase family protein, partial [Planctomycetota bacterium]
PLVVTVALALLEHHGVDAPFCFDRKEAKDHGEGGRLVGHAPADGERVLIVEDVTTAGTSIRETVPLLRGAADVRLAGLIVSVDRMERGSSPDRTALEAVGEEFSMPTASIVDLDAIVARLRPGGGAPSALTAAELERIAAYRAEWGVRRSSDATAP